MLSSFCHSTRKTRRATASIAAIVLWGVGGCGQKKDGDKKAASATPKPSATTAPLPVNVAVEGLQSTLFDKNGQIVAQISAKEAATGTKNKEGAARPEGLGLLKTAHAVLFKNGKPSAQMDADTMEADRQTRIVVGTGNVRLKSLQADAKSNAPALRADTMTWKHDTDEVRGKGNVLITNGPDVSLPGENFEGNTALRTFRVWNGQDPQNGAAKTKNR